MICQLFTHEPEGGSAMIPLNLFMEIYEWVLDDQDQFLNFPIVDNTFINSGMIFYINRYLAGLACDINERSLLDEDTTLYKDGSVQHTRSINSQDTDMDINLDLELIPKDDLDLSKSMLFTIE